MIAFGTEVVMNLQLTGHVGEDMMVRLSSQAAFYD